MKRLLAATVLLLVLSAGTPAAEGEGVGPEEAVCRLWCGNGRFYCGRSALVHVSPGRVRETAGNGQKPFAAILACSDSRVPPEIVFNQGIGDIFVVRVAGNVCDATQIGSIEYGVEHTGTRLVVILGHSLCGAVTAACTGGGREGNIEHVVRLIEPAVRRIEAATGRSGAGIVEDCARENVFLQIESLFAKSPLLRSAVNGGKAMVVGALYDVHSGQAAFLGRHPREGELLAE